MKIKNVKTITTLQKNWKLLAFQAIALLAGFQSMAQSASPSSPQESMRVSLYQLSATGTTTLADGNLTNYDDSYSNGLEDDAPKMNNFGENFGIFRLNTKLAIEQRRKITVYDTTFFAMWNMQQRNYRLLINTYNLEHPGLEGYLEDKYLNTSTPLALNSLNSYDFTVSSASGSYVQDRFRITFRNPTLIPLATTFNSFTGRLNTNKVELQWIVNNEVSIREYVLERAIDRIHFSTISRALATNTPGVKTYASVDPNYFKGDNFYRVKSIGMNGEIQYSSVVKISGGSLNQEILIFPNPVADKRMNLVMSGQKSGKYFMTMYNSLGSMIPLPALDISTGESTQTIQLPATLPPGVYRVRITSPDNVTTIKTINVL